MEMVMRLLQPNEVEEGQRAPAWRKPKLNPMAVSWIIIFCSRIIQWIIFLAKAAPAKSRRGRSKKEEKKEESSAEEEEKSSANEEEEDDD